MATKPRTGAAQYIGVSAEEFLNQIDREVKSGQWDDGTQLKPHVREALGQFSKTARAQRLRPRHYVFVWSRYIFIKIEF